jgi:hypothetical protein
VKNAFDGAVQSARHHRSSDQQMSRNRGVEMSVEQEFAVVDIVLQSGMRTRAVDAFTLSVVKMERQIRRIFTYLVYQSKAFGRSDVAGLRAALEDCPSAYFDGFILGIDALLRLPVAELIGAEYVALQAEIELVTKARNKIFHGQLTNRSLGEAQLRSMVEHIRRWCELLAAAAQREFRYDGFSGNSFHKATIDLSAHYRHNLATVDEYRRFIRDNVARKRGQQRRE